MDIKHTPSATHLPFRRMQIDCQLPHGLVCFACSASFYAAHTDSPIHRRQTVGRSRMTRAHSDHKITVNGSSDFISFVVPYRNCTNDDEMRCDSKNLIECRPTDRILKPIELSIGRRCKCFESKKCVVFFVVANSTNY